LTKRKSSKTAAAVDVSTILEESTGDFQSSTPVKNNKQRQQVEDPFGFFQVSNVKAEKPISPPKKATAQEEGEEDDNDNKENEVPSDNELSIVTPLNSSQPSSPQKSPHKPPPGGNRTPLRQLNGRELLERMPKRRHIYREDFSSSPEKEPTPRPKRKRVKKPQSSREPTPDEVSQEIDYERINEIKSKFNQIDQFVLDEEEVSPYSSQ
jgi:hypothetical protein